jgi:hypothetical protein
MLVNVARRAAKSKDSINMLGQAWSDGMQTGAVTHMRNGNGEDLWIICHAPSKGCSPRWDADGNLFLDDGSTAIKVAKHTLSNGNVMPAVWYGLSNGWVMAFRSYKNPQRLGGRAGKVKTMTLRYKISDDGNSFPLRKQSVNGRLVQLPVSGTLPPPGSLPPPRLVTNAHNRRVHIPATCASSSGLYA